MITTEYKKLENIKPGTDPKPSEEYVKVTFKLGEHGKEFADGDSSFYVKKNVEVELKGPKVLPKDGYKFTKWNKDLKGKFTKSQKMQRGFCKNKIFGKGCAFGALCKWKWGKAYIYTKKRKIRQSAACKSDDKEMLIPMRRSA